jgi:hypothetical protein
MAAITDALAHVRDQPGIVLGHRSIQMLEAYLEGFLFARRESNGLEDYQLLSEFNDWVRKRYHVKDGQGWAKIIAFQSTGESGEWDLFWSLFHEFLENHGHELNGRRAKTASK